MASDYAKPLGAHAPRHPPAAGSVPARRRGEVRGPLEGRRRRLLRARRPRRHRASAWPSWPILRRAGRRTAARHRRPARRRAGRSSSSTWSGSAELPTQQAGPLARYAAPSRASAATTTARCCRSAPRTCGRSPSSTTCRRRTHRAADRLGRAGRRPRARSPTTRADAAGGAETSGSQGHGAAAGSRPGSRRAVTPATRHAGSAARTTWRFRGRRRAVAARRAERRLEVLQTGQHAVDEPRRVVGGQLLRQLDRLVDRHRVGDVVDQSSS